MTKLIFCCILPLNTEQIMSAMQTGSFEVAAAAAVHTSETTFLFQYLDTYVV